MDELNTCDKLIFHLTGNIDGGTTDANTIEIQWVKFKFKNSGVKSKHPITLRVQHAI